MFLFIANALVVFNLLHICFFVIVYNLFIDIKVRHCDVFKGLFNNKTILFINDKRMHQEHEAWTYIECYINDDF